MKTKKILCYIYNDMADFEISVLLHYLKNIGGYEITAQGHAFVDFAEAVCKYLDVFETEEMRREHFGKMRGEEGCKNSSE
ncbi:MAG: hypothetical protein IJD26_08570 [Lachnospiraceae bacterium]|nr:hypothetical protein [Lachnospiraceae bacterium]